MLEQIIAALQETVVDMVSGFAAFFPRMLVGLILIFIGWIIARVGKTLITRIGARSGIDSLIQRTELDELLAQVGILHPPSELVGAAFYWFMMLSFLVQGFREMGLQEAIQPLEGLIEFIPSGIAALIIFVIGFLLSNFVGRSVSGACESIGIEFHDTLGKLARFLILAMVTIIVMEQVGLDVAIINQILMGTVIIIIAGLALAFGLGGRSIAQNVLAGFYARELFTEGDVIIIDGQEGELEGIGTLNSEIRIGNDRLTVPNTRLTEDKVTRREFIP